ncbi:hypothetical protein FDG2_1689 [Candidatus Protofrankia californiensis]|uniref:Bacteriophage Mu GpT domain-containing protein n=1 Tax=Candidatus Protofrankia californiensis TaxID=1839754 RepID=A0A1C3NW34_9ACTN|nr:hypothetical protein FDG2_1689 [Candidatus Protofrankia californiensis]
MTDKKRAALEATFRSDAHGGGYRSIREAFQDWTGARPEFLGEDFNRRVLRESLGAGFHSGRTVESLDSASWAQALGDAVHRVLIAEYARPGLQTWQRIVSGFSYGLDFRTQRRPRVGGYGLLPAVAEGAPYQPLDSPPDEEAQFAISKRGGTEDLTLEMIANDDVGALQRIPQRLGRAAAVTLYRHVWDLLAANGTCTYDSTALFHASHSNTDTSVPLSQSTLSLGRRAMIRQASYGQATDILEIEPRYLVVPADLEEIAFQLTTSLVAIPATPAGPSDTPNIHRGLEVLRVPYFTDANDWYIVGDPAMCPTIELGFYSNSPDPELFTQADPNSGSVFNIDAVSWKIRHVYSAVILDHRGFYRGQG